MRIAVLGAGSWGTTLAIVLANNMHDVSLWSYREKYTEIIRATHQNPSFIPGVTLPETIVPTSDLEEAVRDKQMIVTAVPSQYLRGVVGNLKNHSFSDCIVVNVAKGIEINTMMTMSEMLHDALPQLMPARIATLSGPSHAEEVSQKIPTTVVAASRNITTSKAVQAAFMTPYFRVYASDDLRGVELGGSLKNVIAIAAGVIDGAKLGDNTKAALMTRGIAEITRLGVKLGARERTFSGLSGIGDLMVTCMSKHSRNRFVGEEIGKGRKLQDILAQMVMVAEGVETTRSARELARKVGVEVPIVNEVYNMLFKGKSPQDACYDLMTRDPKGEV